MTAVEPQLDLVLADLEEQRRGRRAVMSTSADRAARVLREQVVEGRLRSGTRLPEERLAGAVGVSRNTLREALSQLVAERILVREPHRGVVVSTPHADDVRDVYRVRRILEPSSLLLHRPDDGTSLRPLRRAVQEGQEAAARDDWAGVASANQHFHRAVVALSRSPRMDSMMDLLLAEMRLFFHQMDRPQDFHRPYLAENAAITDLLESGDPPAAADRLAAYLAVAEEQLVAAFAH